MEEERRYAVGKGKNGDRTAGTEKVANEASEKEQSALAGQPLKSREETGAKAPRLGRTQYRTDREDDADGPGRPKAKNGAAVNGRKAWRRLVRMHGGREMRGG